MDLKDFSFSQNALQDFQDCNFRFKLRYVDHLAWPAAETDDQLLFEKHQKQGNDLHRLIQQLVAGVPEEKLAQAIDDPQVQLWWDAFHAGQAQLMPVFDEDPEIIRLAEHTLIGRLDGERLIAKFDLLVIYPEKKLWIYDWKTTRYAVGQNKLAEKIQTMLYPMITVQAGAHWNHGKAWQPEQIEMVYWLAADPRNPVHFPYHSSQYQVDREYLSALMDEIKQLPEDGFEKTLDISRCRFCPFRSYCDRGVQPGSINELEDAEDNLLSGLADVLALED